MSSDKCLPIEQCVDSSHSDNDQEEDLMYNEEKKPLYSRIAYLGQGTYGFVYLAKHISTSKKYVIKQMKRSRTGKPEGMDETHLREISFLQTLSHRHVIKLHHIFFTQNHDLCLVLEACKMDLSQYMHQHKYHGISVELMQQWSYQMIDAVSYIHSKRILHRDIKPQNVLITERLQVKICDFGLARQYEFDRRYQHDLSSKVVTLFYKPPELLLGCKRYDTKLDVWSLGCVIAQMARNGNLLFDGTCEWELLLSIFQLLGTPNVSEEHNEWCTHLPYFSSAFPKYMSSRFEYAMGRLRSNETACDLLKKMLMVDPGKRHNAIRLLRHAWFEQMERNADNDNHREMTTQTRRKRKSKRVVACSPVEISECKETPKTEISENNCEETSTPYAKNTTLELSPVF